MARGFESKDVEYQQAERERAERTQEQRAADSRRGAIELSLARMRAEHQQARVAAHLAMLDRAIATLEADLASLS